VILLARNRVMGGVSDGGRNLKSLDNRVILFEGRNVITKKSLTWLGILAVLGITISRNPLYFGSVLVITGIALMLNMLWALGALLLSIILCHRILIVPEEKYLIARFGKEYKDYMVSVHRWFGRKRSKIRKSSV
jgi:protein-S-isoprenylcysteine O-methyltransferase Ste14